MPAAGGPPPPPAGGPPPPPGGSEPGGPPIPESIKKNNLNLLLESDDIFGDEYIDLSKASNSLGDIEQELDKLLNS